MLPTKQLSLKSARPSAIAVRTFGTGLWYWLNADAGVLNPFPLSLAPDQGPIELHLEPPRNMGYSCPG